MATRERLTLPPHALLGWRDGKEEGDGNLGPASLPLIVIRHIATRQLAWSLTIAQEFQHS